jgi:subtilisin-like proprotein convertase family protein
MSRSARTYANKTAVKTSRGKPDAVSTIAISDAKPIYDLHVTFSVSDTQNLPLTVTLKGPDGTTVTLVAGAVVNGTVTYETTAFDGKALKGTWTLEVDGLSGGTLNSWSQSILEAT